MNSMTRVTTIPFYIIRHGLATHSLVGYGDSILTAELLPEGMPAVERLAAHMRDQQLVAHEVWSSPVKRCMQTAKIVADVMALPQHSEPRISEQVNETLGEIVQRISSWLDDVIETKPSAVVVCTHGAVIAVLTHFLLGRDGQIDEQDYVKPAGLRLIQGGKHISEHDFAEGVY